jgi:hypothetical protein
MFTKIPACFDVLIAKSNYNKLAGEIILIRVVAVLVGLIRSTSRFCVYEEFQ